MKRLLKYEFAGIVFTIIVGSLLHFTYDMSGKNNIVALFSAVSESTWEHLKLIFMPYVLYGMFEYATVGEEHTNLITSKLLGVLAGMITIIFMFYGYTAIFEDNVVVDILIFVIGVIVAYAVSFCVMGFTYTEFNYVSFVLLVVLLLLFFIFTFNTPTCGIFKKP